MGGYLCLYVMGSSQRNACYRTDFLNIGQWYHVVGTQDGPGNKPLKLDIDGVERGTGLTPDFISDANQLRIANWNDNWWENRPFDGSLGLVTIYSQALSAAEVMDLYTARTNTAETRSPSSQPSRLSSRSPSPFQSSRPSSTPSWSSFFPTIAPSVRTYSPSAAISEAPSIEILPPTSRPSITSPQEDHTSTTWPLSDDVTMIGIIVGGVVMLGLIGAIVAICKFCMSNGRDTHLPQDNNFDQHVRPSAPPVEAMVVSSQVGSFEISKAQV